VLLLGILKGVMVAVVASMLLLIRRAAQPHVAFLGRIPGTRGYSDIGRNPDNEADPAALLFRVEASLVRDILRGEGLEERVGFFGRKITVADAIDEFHGGTSAVPPAVPTAPAV